MGLYGSGGMMKVKMEIMEIMHPGSDVMPVGCDGKEEDEEEKALALPFPHGP